jgi:hypothetical protein
MAFSISKKLLRIAAMAWLDPLSGGFIALARGMMVRS